ncbi:MAG: GNAT family N-acetyltransferase [Paracoccus sp. (in: a-proteobacteria)]|uniref:GNAT family N-acetyltransferase n=1 Tax=Paracoccus sp. TaxID=267 RepID=UPI0026E02799|nr:GNAT family N-acetyltransferase [Paracoccus sp. (in: a-proteobacteria)]MDO5632490.1 GNAT family N-acetyltransferase [Paracoccus sp. (in: a-proteobacteria)]
MRVLSPIPDPLLPRAARLWWGAFGRTARPLGDMGQAVAARGVVAMDNRGQVVGVMGLRDASGGFFDLPPGWLDWLYRPGPATDDLVVDGIVVCADSRRAGVGRALVAAALAHAQALGRPGLRAEVLARNRVAVGFWSAVGFELVGRGRAGWIWNGPALYLRRGVQNDGCGQRGVLGQTGSRGLGP